jgi:hypothetical protein
LSDRRSIWSELGLPGPTADPGEIRRAYARRLRSVHPEDDAAGFQVLRGAYEAAMAGRGRVFAPPPDTVGVGAPVADAEVAEAELADAAPPPVDEPAAPRRQDPWPRLERLLTGTSEPAREELLAGLEGVLADASLERLSQHLAAEQRLAGLILQTSPRSDVLIEPAVNRFGWEWAKDDRFANRTVLAVLARRAIAGRLAAIAELERVVSGPTPPDEATLYRALNPVTEPVRDNNALWSHVEGELARLIVEHAPNMDAVLGEVVGRMSWRGAHAAPAVNAVIDRYERQLQTLHARTGSRPSPRTRAPSSAGGTGGRVGIPVFFIAMVVMAAVRLLSAAGGGYSSPPQTVDLVPVTVPAGSDDFPAAMPASAQVQLRCHLAAGASVADCSVLSETPAGEGFGEAAKLAARLGPGRLPRSAYRHGWAEADVWLTRFRGEIRVMSILPGGAPQPAPGPPTVLGDREP